MGTAPPVPPTPKLPAPAPTPTDPAVQEARRRALQRNRQGLRTSTLLTGPKGPPGNAKLGIQTLLGGATSQLGTSNRGA